MVVVKLVGAAILSLSLSYLVMGEAMQEAPLVGVLDLNHNVSVSASAGRRNNILVEGEGNEDDDGDEIHRGAHRAHAFRDLAAIGLAQVAPSKAGLDKRRAEPADHGVAERKGNERERQRRNEGLAIAAEGVCEDGERGAGEGDEAERFGAGELRRGGAGRAGDGHGFGRKRGGFFGGGYVEVNWINGMVRLDEVFVVYVVGIYPYSTLPSQRI